MPFKYKLHDHFLCFAVIRCFCIQAAASSNVGKAAGKARSSAADLYVSFYYFGGGLGSVLSGFFWERFGWVDCVALILFMQIGILFLANMLWKD